MGKITNSRILVTGGAGFIGSHVTEMLVDQKNDVTVVDITRLPNSLFVKHNLKKFVNFHNIDIRNRKKITSLIHTVKPHYIFHLAAQAIVDTAYLHPLDTLETNIMGTANILEAARTTPGIRAIVVASSDKAYGKKGEKYTEHDPLRGDHPYEVSKSATDLLSYTYYKTYALPVVITRFGNVYGEGDANFSRIIPGIMEALIRNKTLILRSNGKFIRDYLYVRDVARGYIQLAEHIQKTKGEAYNFGSRETLSVIQLIDKIQKILGKNVRYTIKNTAKNEIVYQSLIYSKVKKTIGWKPIWTLEKTIPDVYDYYQSIL